MYSKSNSLTGTNGAIRPHSIYGMSFTDKPDSIDRVESKLVYPCSPSRIPVTDARRELDFKTPIAPPRSRNDEARKTAEKARQDARERARLMSDEDLGLSPEDRIKELRLKVARRQLRSETDEDTPAKSTKRYSFGLYRSPGSANYNKLPTSKSTDNVKAMTVKKMNNQEVTAKSLDELLASPDSPTKERPKEKGKKSKDPERRKSIIQAVSDFFKKKDSLSPPAKDNKLSMFRFTPKSKEKGKVRNESFGVKLTLVIVITKRGLCLGLKIWLV